MIGLEGKTLSSERLRYRLMQSSDKVTLSELLSDAEVTRTAGFLPAKTQKDFDDFFAALTMYNTCIAILLDEKLIGYIHVGKYKTELPELSGKFCVGLGFVIGKEYQNKGYGTETVKTVTDYLLSRFDCCFADCFAENKASAKVMEKCGYTYVEDYTMYFKALREEYTCHSYFHM